MWRERTSRIARLAALCALTTSLAFADDAKPEEKSEPAEKPRSAQSEDSAAARPTREVAADHVITNEELERMMQGLSPLEARAGVYQGTPGAAPEAQPAEPPPASGSPAKPAIPAGTKPGPPKTPPGEAEQRVADLQARVAELEKAVLAVRNPLLPRSWTTPDSLKKEDEDSGYSDLDNAARLGQREAELAQAREELAKARQELTRQGGGSD